MKRNRGYYRHHRRRIIKKKMKELKLRTQFREQEAVDRRIEEPGRLAKAANGCHHYFCHFEKIHQIPKACDKSKLDLMQIDIDDYLM